MDKKELICLFTGYGYQVRFVEDMEDIDNDMHTSMVWAIDEIHKIQQAARSGSPVVKPRWPLLILMTPKVSIYRSPRGQRVLRRLNAARITGMVSA